MSLPRSIDRTDLGAGSVSIPGTTETVALVGPLLQTPKDTSIIVALVSLAFTVGTSGTAMTARVRLGSAVGGAQVGQPYVYTGLSAGQQQYICFQVSLAAQQTDYVQLCVTLQQTAATGPATVQGGTLLAISF